jgi:hypothetical protein
LDNRSRTEKQYSENGQILSIVNYFDSLCHGKSTIYKQFGGIIETERNYKFGKLNGLVKSYFPNGNIQFESNFCNGQQHGSMLEYYENGRIKLKVYIDTTAAVFQDSELKLFGDQIYYNEDGSVNQKFYVNKDGSIINKQNESNISKNSNVQFKYINNSKSKCEWCGKYVYGCVKKKQSEIEDEKNMISDGGFGQILYEVFKGLGPLWGIEDEKLSILEIDLYNCPDFCSPKCEYESKEAGN